MAEMLTVQVERPDQAALNKGSEQALELVEDFVIDSPVMYEIAGDELRNIKAKAAALDEQRKAITRPMDDAKKAVMDLFRGPLDLLARAESALKQKMLGYQREQERVRLEEQRRAEAAVRAERERIAAEAAELEQAGKAEEAMVKREVAALVVAPAMTVAAAAPKLAGVSKRTTIDFEVVDLLALVQHVAAHPDLLGVLAVDTVKLRALVRALGAKAAIPGVRVFEKESIAAGRR